MRSYRIRVQDAGCCSRESPPTGSSLTASPDKLSSRLILFMSIVSLCGGSAPQRHSWRPSRRIFWRLLIKAPIGAVPAATSCSVRRDHMVPSLQAPDPVGSGSRVWIRQKAYPPRFKPKHIRTTLTARPLGSHAAACSRLPPSAFMSRGRIAVIELHIVQSHDSDPKLERCARGSRDNPPCTSCVGLGLCVSPTPGKGLKGFLGSQLCGRVGVVTPEAAERPRERSEAGIRLPFGVVGGSYLAAAPLVRHSRLTTKRKGGVGKKLSDGWSCNFAVGCTHACPFCYVDGIHKRFGKGRYGDAVLQRWGDYLLIPSNLDEAIEETPWERWEGEEVMMSSTHDPYLPKLAEAARKILEHALPAGVRVCLQTRSFLVTKDFALLQEYRDQVRLQVSIATMNRELARLIEPRVPPPETRVQVLRLARQAGLDIGVILAPILPPVRIRPDVPADIRDMVEHLEDLAPNHVYGECLHVRGQNLRLLEQALGETVRVTPGFDKGIAKTFHEELRKSRLHGTWWYEHRG